MTSGYVYAVKVEGDEYCVKFGRTKNPDQRFKSFRTIAGYKLKVIGVVAVSDMKSAERTIKRKIQRLSCPCEWVNRAV